MPDFARIGLGLATGGSSEMNRYLLKKAGVGNLSDLNPFSAGSDVKADRARQIALAEELQAAAQGRGGSAAETQFRTAGDQLVAQQYALAASQPGLAPAAALRQASMGSAQLGQGLAGQAAAARIAEQERARQQYAALLAQLQEQDAAERARKVKLGMDLTKGIASGGMTGMTGGGGGGGFPMMEG